MPKFAALMTAIDSGIKKVAVDKGISMVKDWEGELSSVDTPGAKAIVHDLEALRKHLEKSEPDSAQIRTILVRLGEATVKIAEKADKSGDKLTALGKALSKAA